MSVAKKEMFGIGITDATEDYILEYVIKSLENKGNPYYIVTPNPEILMAAQRSSSLKSALNGAGIALCDGIGLLLASKLIGKPIKERITGVDFMETLCKESVRIGKKDVRKPIAVGFLGGRNGVAEKAAECLIQKYPGLEIGFIAEEWAQHGFDTAQIHKIKTNSPKLHAKLTRYTKYEEAIRSERKTIDILFVAYGFPKQEEWMQAHVGKLPVTVMMGVGGAFDYISGSVGRAPGILRILGLEWLYRLIRQPWRVWRQLALIDFILLVLRERFRR